MANIIGVIPARWGSTRFPGKPLHPIAGKPLVLHVWDQCTKCTKLAGLVIATDDSRIKEACEAHGAKVVMTSDQHPTGTDRLVEVADGNPAATHFINIQGDEPLIAPALVDQLADELALDKTLEMVTAATPIRSQALIQDTNVVKVVLNQKRDALYFSRAPIPHIRNEVEGTPFYRHLGIYGYQTSFLKSYSTLGRSTLEESESLEQLRALDYGARIRVVITKDDAMGVDTLEQANEVERLLNLAT